MARVLQIMTPCTDDFIGPFDTLDEAEQWAYDNGLKREEFLAHDMVSPDSDQVANWKRLPVNR